MIPLIDASERIDGNVRRESNTARLHFWHEGLAGLGYCSQCFGRYGALAGEELNH